MIPKRPRPERPAADAFPVLLGLTALGLVQPVLGLLSRNPAFLAVHGLEGPVLVLFPALLAVGAGAAAWLPVALARRLRPGWAGAIHAMTAWTVLALGLRPPFARVLPGPDPVAAGVAAVLAGGLVLVVAGRPRLRKGVALVAWAAPLVVAAFLMAPGIRPLLAPAPAAATAPNAPPPAAGTPIVMIVFDAFPLASLLDGTGAIDPVAYPCLAALAHDATWYRGALGVSDDTVLAVPAILTGSLPRRDAPPTLRGHPDNLFTWLAPSRPLHVFESHTRLAPGGGPERPAARWRLLLADLGVVAGRVLLPAAVAGRLPGIEGRWKDFGGGIDPQDRDALLAGFLASLATDEENSCWFLHLLLPHPPYSHYPSGRAYAHDGVEPGGQGLQAGPWSDDPQPVVQSQRRHLLQAGWADACVGRVVEILRRRGLYDRTLLVVTADHGAAFTPGLAHRMLTPANAGEILPVPLLIKPPRPTAGRRDTLPARSTDILPTMASLLGTRLPWPHDGRDLRSPGPTACPESLTVAAATRDVTVDRAATEAQLHGAVATKLERFGAAAGLPHLFAPGRGAALLGTAPTVLPPAPGRRAALEGSASLTVTDDAPLPAEVRGVVTGDAPWPPDWDVAVTVDGRVAAVTHPRRVDAGDGLAPWATLLPEDVLPPGRHALDVLLLRWQEGRAVCHAGGAAAIDVLDVDLLQAGPPGLTRSGLAPVAGGDPAARRMAGSATITLRSVGTADLGALQLGVGGTGPGDAALVVAANSVPVGVVPVRAGGWQGLVDLSGVNCLDGLQLDFYGIVPGGRPPALVLEPVRLRARGAGIGPVLPLPQAADLYPHDPGTWRLAGFHRSEPWGKGVASWTDGEARASLDLDRPARPRFVLLDLAATGPAGTHLVVTVNGRVAFAGDLPRGPWRGCAAVPAGPPAEKLVVGLDSPAFVPAATDGALADTRRLGVAVRGLHVVF